MTRPWQYKWKRPKLEVKERHFCNEPVNIKAALLTPVEIEQLLANITKNDDKHLLLSHISEDKEESLLLTITLSGGDQSNKLLLHLQGTHSQKIILHREFHWPGFIIGEDDRLVSIALCRRTDESITLLEAEALDVLQLMSLGNFDVDINSFDNSITTSVSNNRDESPVASNIDETSLPQTANDLVLACLTKERIYLYKVIDLFNTHTSNSEGIETGFASLLLGSSMLQQVEKAVLPLSRPYATIELTLSNNDMRWKKKQPAFEIKKAESHIDPWDPSLWDATIEKSTVIYQTQNNEVFEVVSSFGYLAVVGRGRRIRRVREKKTKSVVIVEGIEALEEDIANHDDEDEIIDEKWLVEEKKGERGTHDLDIDREDKDGWWKESTGRDSDCETADKDENGGFITFVDLEHSSESRILFLPFAPKEIYPIRWGDMAFVIVLADETSESDISAKAIAIRIDASNKIKFRCGDDPTGNLAQDNKQVGMKKGYSSCEVRRFQLIPIILPVENQLSFTTTTRALAASSIWCDSPCIELFHSTFDNESNEHDITVTLASLISFDMVAETDLPSYILSCKPGKFNVVIQSMQKASHVARIPLQLNESYMESSWSQVFQGCSLLRVQGHSFFICWDGATESEGAYVEALRYSDHLATCNLHCDLLPFDNIIKGPIPGLNEAETHDAVNKAEPSMRLLNLSFAGAQKNTKLESDRNFNHSTIEVEQIIVDALDSISSLDYLGEETFYSKKEKIKMKRTERLSHVEKSSRLVRDCESWSNLDDTKENRALFEQQTPLSISISDGRMCVFSLRSRFIQNGRATPFKQVVSWLSQAEDFITATSIALSILRDDDSLNELKSLESRESVEQRSDDSDVETLLEGIVPLYPQGSLSLRPRPSIITEVADLTIGCLAKGGLVLATTLDFFLKKNIDYNHARACLMLVSILTRCVSFKKSVVEKAMGSGYEFSDASQPDDLLWALRSLLALGLARDYLSQVIFLVNASMPDELRCDKNGKKQSTPIFMEFCKAMVSTILSSSAKAAPLLLSQVDENSRMRYWESLSHNVQLEFSLIRVPEDSPLLREPEVRNWALDCLDDCVKRETDPIATNVFQKMPNEWLQKLCEACLINSECDYDRILTNGIDDSESGCFGEGAIDYLIEFQRTLQALSTSYKSDGLDFGLMIPALLILERRDCLWNGEAVVSTRRVLDAVCHMAGRQKESGLGFDGAKAMQQCASAKIISAGAFLCGGVNGLILNCCDVLIQETGIDMELAESYIMNETLFRDILSKREDKVEQPFVITEGHKKTLWMISEYILNVKTFGEFNPCHLRGKVDPVFAAQACLRTWLFLSPSKNSTAWLVHWLQKQLEIDDGEISPKRLPCAALTRALVWPATEKSKETLAEGMKMDNTFLVQLAQACHGLIESVPRQKAEEIISRADLKPGKSVSV